MKVSILCRQHWYRRLDPVEVQLDARDREQLLREEVIDRGYQVSLTKLSTGSRAIQPQHRDHLCTLNATL